MIATTICWSSWTTPSAGSTTHNWWKKNLVEEESTRMVMAARREVIELYSDRASHFFITPKAGEAVDKSRLTQVRRAPKELGVQMMPTYSPQARGRSERSFGTWQGRLPQEPRDADAAFRRADRSVATTPVGCFERKVDSQNC